MKKIINPWKGVEGYLCFACSPDNPSGLHMEFYEEEDDIVSLWKPTNYQQGWLNILHGGIQCTLMDELAAWVILKKLQTTGVTSKIETKFIKSIATEEPLLTIRGRIKDKKRNIVFVDTEIYNSAGELCSRAEVIYAVVSPERARESFFFSGCQTEE
ncbi:MAG: PaaI family thioesterase [Tannerellaceae bacterium]|jgi:acyl-coenzyme A thioesterase PaaI-like protein|nr:PaaI family thioesterase [Tannerellaceae bacterium]